MFHVEIKDTFGTWRRFTLNPFDTYAQAEERIVELRGEFPVAADPERLRITEISDEEYQREALLKEYITLTEGISFKQRLTNVFAQFPIELLEEFVGEQNVDQPA
jgi:hypothetical protein